MKEQHSLRQLADSPPHEIENHLPDSGLIAAFVSHTGFMLYGSPEYLATKGIPDHLYDLHACTMIGYVAPGTARRFQYRFTYACIYADNGPC